MEPVQEINKIEYFNVYNMRYAASLMLDGFRPVIVRNNKDKRYYVFRFRNTKEFQEAFQRLVNA